MNDGPEGLFAKSAVEAKRQRAGRINKQGAGFLLDIVAEDFAERLHVTNRDFANGIELFPLAEPSPVFSVLEKNCTHRAQRLKFDTVSSETLPLEANSADLVLTAFSLHWMNDLPGMLVQISRVLRPDGLFMGTFPGEGTLAELRESLMAAEMELSDGAAMRVDPFAEIRALGGLLQRAGLALPVADQDRFTVRYKDIFSLIDDIRAMGIGSSLVQNSRFPPRELFETADRIYRDRFADADGRIRATFNITHLSGWSPHESQQKPLKPGSADVSLKDFL